MENIERLSIPDVLLITPRKFSDNRGFFSETYNRRALAEAGINAEFVQDNHSLSTEAGTLRGLHFQTAPHAQGKLVRVLKGRILDVVVDIRRESSTYGEWLSAELSAEAFNQIWVPEGCAHGILTLEPDTEIIYKVTDYYAPECDKGIAWDDPDLDINWPLPASKIILSEKDSQQPSFKDLPNYF